MTRLSIQRAEQLIDWLRQHIAPHRLRNEPPGDSSPLSTPSHE